MSSSAGFMDWLDRQLQKPSVNYGFWQCDACYIAAPSEPKESSGLSDLKNFIQANNDEIHSSKNEPVHRWIPQSTITICNQSGVCITVAYQADTLLWMPVGPSFPKPPGVTPKKPKVQDVGENDPEGTIGGTVDLWPVGLPSPTSQWNITIMFPPREPRGEVIIIHHTTYFATYQGTPFALDLVREDVGSSLGWGAESWGLTWGNPGYCYDGSFCDSTY